MVKGGKIFKWGYYSRGETIQGRKLLIIRRFWPRKLFKGGNYSREETIWGNTVTYLCFENSTSLNNWELRLTFLLKTETAHLIFQLFLISWDRQQVKENMFVGTKCTEFAQPLMKDASNPLNQIKGIESCFNPNSKLAVVPNISKP